MGLADLPNTFIWFLYGKWVGKYTIWTWSLWLLHLYTRVSNHLEMIVMIRHHKQSDTKENPSPHSIHVWYILLPIFTYIHKKPFKKSTIHVGWCRFPYKYIPIKNGWCGDHILPAWTFSPVEGRGGSIPKASFVLCHPIDATSSTIRGILGELGVLDYRLEFKCVLKELWSKRIWMLWISGVLVGCYFWKLSLVVVSAANSQPSWSQKWSLECFSYQKEWDQEGIKAAPSIYPNASFSRQYHWSFQFCCQGIPGSHFFDGSKKTDLN